MLSEEQHSWPEVESRARAAFLGVALGDALGATTEFMTPREIRSVHGVHDQITGGGWLYLKPGQVTDDTEMSLCIGQAVLDKGQWHLETIAESFVEWMQGRPVDIGATCARGIRNTIIHGSLEVPENQWDAGNGALMRMAPVALLTLGDDLLLVRYAREQAHLTHNNPLSDAACSVVGRMVHMALGGAPLDKIRDLADGFASNWPKFNYSPYPGNSSAYVVDTVQTVFHFLFSTRSFEECLVGTVNQGGDADTTGAIAGMLAGAIYGETALPRRWLKRLDANVKKEIVRQADGLIRLSPAARIGLDDS